MIATITTKQEGLPETVDVFTQLLSAKLIQADTEGWWQLVMIRRPVYVDDSAVHQVISHEATWPDIPEDWRQDLTINIRAMRSPSDNAQLSVTFPGPIKMDARQQ